MTAVPIDGLQAVQVHTSMRSEAQEGLRAHAVRMGEIDPSLHYRSAHQADLWWRVHQAFAPQRSSGPLPIYVDVAHAVARARDDVAVVAVGAGGGEKEALVVRECAGHAHDLPYIPIDVGLELALRSAEAATGLGVVAQPVVGDIVAMSGVEGWLRQVTHGRRRIVTAYGITPNIAPELLLGRLHEMVGTDGELLISANLLTTWDEVLPQYDNSPTAEWLWQLVRDWGLADLLTPLRFEVTEVGGIPAVVALTSWKANAQIELDDEVVAVSQGHPLRLFTSRRFTPELFAATCAGAGFEVIESFLDSSGQEGVWRMRPLLPAERASGHSRTQ